MNKISEFLRIKEASDYLGVSPNTLRNWVDAGKIQAFRHPMNSYRLFDPKQLDSLLKDFNKAFTKKNKITTPR
jgi:excisionase family DNA binding protein